MWAWFPAALVLGGVFIITMALAAFRDRVGAHDIPGASYSAKMRAARMPWTAALCDLGGLLVIIGLIAALIVSVLSGLGWS